MVCPKAADCLARSLARSLARTLVGKAVMRKQDGSQDWMGRRLEGKCEAVESIAFFQHVYKLHKSFFHQMLQ